jgi:cytosine/adenosine deaminase-related metal-dependent hydrolase
MSFLTAHWVLPVAADPIENGFVEIGAEGQIVAVGAISQLSETLSSPMPGSILTPGLINVHTHLEQSWPQTLRKERDGSFLDWLLAVIRLNRSGASSEGQRQRCEDGIEVLLSTGTTCINDIASGLESLACLDAAGLRGIVSLECFHPAAEPVPTQIDRIAAAYADFAAPYWNHPLLKTGLSPHTPYNVSARAWQALLAEIQPTFVHTHVAEWVDAEALYLQGRGGPVETLHQEVIGQTFAPSFISDSSIAHLAEAGLLRPRLVLAHCLQTSAADRKLLEASPAGSRETGSQLGLAHCPRSNVALHGKTLDWPDWQNSLLPIGLGTDGRLSTEDLDLRTEGRVAQKLHGWSDEETLNRLTVSGACVLGLEKKIGQLKPGFAADCVLWQCASDTLPDSPEQALAAFLLPSTRAEEVYIQGECRWRFATTSETLKSTSIAEEPTLMNIRKASL